MNMTISKLCIKKSYYTKKVIYKYLNNERKRQAITSALLFSLRSDLKFFKMSRIRSGGKKEIERQREREGEREGERTRETGIFRGESVRSKENRWESLALRY